MLENGETKRAVYPGTFDPVTNGHVSLIERAAKVFDELIVGVVSDSAKNTLFSSEERLELMQQTVAQMKSCDRIKVVGFEGLTAELASRVGAQAIVRGVRAVSDFEYEFQMALMNRKIARNVETVFLMPALSWVYLSSSLIKDVARNGGEVDTLVPDPVARALADKLS